MGYAVLTLPLHIVLDMFESIISVYGSGVWGCNKNAQSETNKIVLRFAIQILRAKPTTSNIIAFGECGVIITMQILLTLHKNGFSTWIGNVCELMSVYDLDSSLTVNEFQNECKIVVCESCTNNGYHRW